MWEVTGICRQRVLQLSARTRFTLLVICKRVYKVEDRFVK